MRQLQNMLSMTRNSYDIQHSVFRAGESFFEHCHDFHEFFIVVRGTLAHTLNGKTVNLPKGAIQLMLPGDYHSLVCGKDSPEVEIFNVHVSPEEMLKNFTFISAGRSFPLEDCTQTVILSSENQLRHLLEMADAIQEGNQFRDSLFRLLTQETLLLLMRHSCPDSSGAPEWLEDSMRQMRDHVNTRAGLPRFLKLSGRSQEHLCRSMKKFYGISPNEFILRLQLELAAFAILHSDRKITELAFDSGFHNLSYFRRCFQKKYGITPLRYRKQYQRISV